MFFSRNKDKPNNKLKSVWPQRIGRIVLWIFIVFVMLRGVGSMLRGSEASKIQTTINQFTEDEKKLKKTEIEATSFAKAFSIEYLTFTGNSLDYSDRLDKYTNLEFNSLNPRDKIEALGAEAMRVEWVNKDILLVDCKVKVKYQPQDAAEGVTANVYSKPGTQPQPTPQKIIKDTYIRIPVTTKDYKYIIQNFPTFIPAETRAEPQEFERPGKDVKAEDLEQIQKVIESFIKIYYEGSPTEISYFMVDNKQLTGLNKAYTFKKLVDGSLTVKQPNPQELKYSVNVQYEVISDGGQVFTQNMDLSVILKDGKYLVNQFNTILK